MKLKLYLITSQLLCEVIRYNFNQYSLEKNRDYIQFVINLTDATLFELTGMKQATFIQQSRNTGILYLGKNS